LEPGAQVPHFEVKKINGGVFRYSTIWQRQHLVLISISEGKSANNYVADLLARQSAFDALRSVFVVTTDRIAGLRTPGALVVDRWGEVIHVVSPPLTDDLPTASELLDWLDYLERRCPECEGEAK
jgi:hypothetical protein